MTSIIKLQALSGVEGESPPCYLLQVDEFRFLLDCGWDEDFSMTHIDDLKKHVHSVDAVLLSYPDPLHLGAIPYMVGKGGLKCPIYATIPVYKMGQMFMYDLYQSRHNTSEFDLFTLDDVDAAFDKIVQLKYSQTINLKGKGHGLQITPLPAGHMVGGTIWKIVKSGEEEIIYMVDYNHKKERHLNGCVLDGIGRPHLLITDAFNADYVQAKRRLRDEQLMTHIIQTMRNDGNVLVCVDTAGRVLELAHLLDQMWRSAESGLMTYSLALLNNVSYNVVEFAKSMVEWMSDKIMRAFEGQRSNPFQFKHVQLCHSLSELAKVPEPKVILASTPDLQHGFSRDLFVQYCSNPKNTIILTNRTSPGTLGRWLIDNPGQQTVTIEVRRRIKLEGEELAEYYKRAKEKEADQARKKADMARREREEMESSSESEAEEEETEQHHIHKAKHDLMMKTQGKTRSGFFKQAKKAYPMFPATEERIKYDDYGEIIRIDDFLQTETNTAEEEKMDTSQADETTKQEVMEIPTKCIATMETIDVLCNVIYIDFEGRSDGESIRKIIAQIKPRQLMLVRGQLKATIELAEYCKRDVIQGQCFMPRMMEFVDATTESHIYQVKLLDSVVSKLYFAKTKDAEIAWLDGVVDLKKKKRNTEALKENDDPNKDPDNFDDDGMETVPCLMPLPAGEQSEHSSVFINEPKLTDFKQVLLSKGIQAEFSAGVLICNNMVAVRRNEAGRLQLEGAISDDYFIVRDLLYGQFAIV